MSGEGLAACIHPDVTWTWTDDEHVCRECSATIRLFTPTELAAHDDRIRAEALAPMHALADGWDDDTKVRHVYWSAVPEIRAALAPAPAPPVAEGKG